MTVEPGRAGESWRDCPRLAPNDAFDFVCTGCGDCCRARRDLVLSGYDLYRLARRMRLPPRAAARAFCKAYTAPRTALPALRLTPDPVTGNCRFLDGGACAVHPARPLACALYPLGQCIDPASGAAEYYAQTPLCGASAGEGRTLGEYLRQSGADARAAVDARWAAECTRLAEFFAAHGGTRHPRYRPAARRAARALYYDYTTADEFYPQFRANLDALWPLLERLYGEEKA